MTAPDVQAAAYKLAELQQTMAMPSSDQSAGAWCEAFNEAVLLAVALAARVEQLERYGADQAEKFRAETLLSNDYARRLRLVENELAAAVSQLRREGYSALADRIAALADTAAGGQENDGDAHYSAWV